MATIKDAASPGLNSTQKPSGNAAVAVAQAAPSSFANPAPFNPLNLRPIATHATSWRPTSARVALNLALDACIVPDATGAARVDKAHLIVLDDFIGEPERKELLEFITQPDWDPQMPPPGDKWDRGTRDRADADPTWGLRGEWLRHLSCTALGSRLEVQSRLQVLYPDYLIAHMPSDEIQNQCTSQIQIQIPNQDSIQIHTPGKRKGEQQHGGDVEVDVDVGEEQRGGSPEEGATAADGGDGEDMATDTAGGRRADAGEEAEGEELEEASGPPPGPSVDCNQFVANAAVYGDTYSWHVDADPSTLPYPSPWTLAYGQYVNREPGRPLFVSLLLYLNRGWEREWEAETLFLDTPTDCGVVVRPKAYRAVLLDQDILHRLTPPSRAALGRPRYSLVWKLVLLPRRHGQQVTLARKAWGRPTPFGSAAALERVVSGLAAAKAAAKTTENAGPGAGVGETAVAQCTAVGTAVGTAVAKVADVPAAERKKRSKRKKKSSTAAAGGNPTPAVASPATVAGGVGVPVPPTGAADSERGTSGPGLGPEESPRWGGSRTRAPGDTATAANGAAANAAGPAPSQVASEPPLASDVAAARSKKKRRRKNADRKARGKRKKAAADAPAAVGGGLGGEGLGCAGPAAEGLAMYDDVDVGDADGAESDYGVDVDDDPGAADYVGVLQCAASLGGDVTAAPTTQQVAAPAVATGPAAPEKRKKKYRSSSQRRRAKKAKVLAAVAAATAETAALAAAAGLATAPTPLNGAAVAATATATVRTAPAPIASGAVDVQVS